jgi:hypothetical protein
MKKIALAVCSFSLVSKQHHKIAFNRNQEMLAFLKDLEVTRPEDVRIKCSLSIETPDASVFKSGCTNSHIFFF